MAATLPGNKGLELDYSGLLWEPGVASRGLFSGGARPVFSRWSGQGEASLGCGHQQRSRGLVVPGGGEAADCWPGLRLGSLFHISRPPTWTPTGLTDLHIFCDSGHFPFLTAIVIGLLHYRLSLLIVCFYGNCCLLGDNFSYLPSHRFPQFFSDPLRFLGRTSLHL